MRSSPGVTIRLLVRSAEVEQSVRSALAGITDMTLEVMRGTLMEAVGCLATGHADALLLDLDLDNPHELLALRQLVRSDGARSPVIVTGANAGMESLRQLMRMQIADYLPQPFEGRDVLAAVEAALKQRQQQDEPGSHQAAVFAFTKAAGGMGATSLAVQTAFELAGHGKKLHRPKVCLVDLDFHAGSVVSYLDIEPQLNILEVIRAPHRLDSHLLDAMVSPHAGGFDVLSVIGDRLPEVEAITPEAIRRLLDIVCEHYEYVVLDLPPVWTRWTASVLGGSDSIFIVLQLSVSAIKQAKQLLRRLGNPELGELRVKLVLNRYRKSLWHRGLRVREAEKALGRSIDHFVASDYRLVSEAHDQGVPLAKVQRRSRIEKQVREIVRAALAARPSATTAEDSKIVHLKAAGQKG